jgi:hypothetical protein
MALVFHLETLTNSTKRWMYHHVPQAGRQRKTQTGTPRGAGGTPRAGTVAETGDEDSDDSMQADVKGGGMD